MFLIRLHRRIMYMIKERSSRAKISDLTTAVTNMLNRGKAVISHLINE